MRFVNRAATSVLSLVCVSALLVAGHWVARHGHHHPPSPNRATRVEILPRHPSGSTTLESRTTGSVTPAALLPVLPYPDCKMPENPPASGPLAVIDSQVSHTSDASSCPSPAEPVIGHGDGSCEHPVLTTEAATTRVYPAVSGREPAAPPHLPRTADARDSSHSPAIAAPTPLPLRTDALPLLPDGPDFPAEPPASAPAAPKFVTAGPAAPGTNPFGPNLPGPNSPNVSSPNVNFPNPNSPHRRMIDRALPNTTPEEREVWHEQLKDLSPRDVRELLRLRDELSHMPPMTVETRPLPGAASPFGPSPFGPSPLGQSQPGQPLWQQNVPGPTASEPLMPGEAPSLLPDGERDAARTIGSSLEAIAQAQQMLLNNVANAGTDGYKRTVVTLESAAGSSSRGSIGMGVRLGAVQVDVAQGKLRKTDRPLDLAIDGEGFFQLEDPRTHQFYYTRCGRFAVNVTGQLVWRNSQRELIVRPFVKIDGPESDVEIAPDGTLKPSVAGDNRPQRIQIVRMPALADLVPTGDNLFTMRREVLTDAARPDPLSGRVRQGCLEESNVDVERELREIERLRNQAHALDLAAQSLPLGARSSLNPPVEPTGLPSHFAGNLGIGPR